MKKVLKKIDWIQVGVLGLGLAASLAKSIYEAKRFNADLEKRYDGNLEKKINEIIDKRIESSK